MKDWQIPIGRGKVLRVSGWTVDDKRSPEEYAAVLRRAEAHGYKKPRRERMPTGRWFVCAQVHEGNERDGHWLGTVVKGWYRVGWSRYRFKTVQAEIAVGGEDSMVQASVHTPLLSGGAGFRVPRRWLRSWVYERRSIIDVKLGYIGSIAHVALFHDDRMADMASYYRDQRAQGKDNGFVTEAMLRNGWAGYIGGASVWDRKVLGTLFGPREYTTTRRGEPVPVTIRMPEGEYSGTCAIVLEQWKRPRARWARRQVATDLQVPDPPMFAGKGENSYDLDDDGFYSSHSRTAKTVEDAVRQYELSVLERRARYGQPRTVA